MLASSDFSSTSRRTGAVGDDSWLPCFSLGAAAYRMQEIAPDQRLADWGWPLVSSLSSAVRWRRMCGPVIPVRRLDTEDSIHHATPLLESGQSSPIGYTCSSQILGLTSTHGCICRVCLNPNKGQKVKNKRPRLLLPFKRVFGDSRFVQVLEHARASTSARNRLMAEIDTPVRWSVEVDFEAPAIRKRVPESAGVYEILQSIEYPLVPILFFTSR